MTVQQIKNEVHLVGLSTDTKPTKLGNEDIGAGSTFWESNTDTLYVFDGNSWFIRVLQYQNNTTGYAENLKGISGASLVNPTDRNGNQINLSHPARIYLYHPLIGGAASFTALPSGAGLGPDSYDVDLSEFGASNIYLVVLLGTGAVAITATIEYFNDLNTARLLHPETPTTIISAVTGNTEVLVPKKDRMARITLSLSGAETVWAYLVGREQA